MASSFRSDRVLKSHWKWVLREEFCLIVEGAAGGGGWSTCKLQAVALGVEGPSTDPLFGCQVGTSRHLGGFLEPAPLQLIDRRLTETQETLKKCPLSQRAMTSTIDRLQSDHYWQCIIIHNMPVNLVITAICTSCIGWPLSGWTLIQS